MRYDLCARNVDLKVWAKLKNALPTLEKDRVIGICQLFISVWQVVQRVATVRTSRSGSCMDLPVQRLNATGESVGA